LQAGINPSVTPTTSDNHVPPNAAFHRNFGLNQGLEFGLEFGLKPRL